MHIRLSVISVFMSSVVYAVFIPWFMELSMTMFIL